MTSAADVDASVDPPALDPAPDRTWDLESLLASRRWIRRADPFPYVTAQNVFVDDFYRQLHEAFETYERDHPEAFQRNMPGYDASGASLETHRDGPLGIFVSREWHDLMASVVGIRGNGDISGSLHHHDPGGKSGWPHNDLNPGWFADPRPGPGQVRMAGTDNVSYNDGTAPVGQPKHRSVRGVSVLFYLGNPEWQPGDGGETGIFQDLSTAARGPYGTVPPINNSIVLFECTPFSFHAFVGNAKPRNSVVMWVHRDDTDAIARWGEHSLVDW